MKRASLLALFGVIAVLALTALRPSGSEAAAGDEFVAALRGSHEVPPVTTDATGRAEITFNTAKTRATFKIVILGGNRITQAHIHCNVRGMNGPIVAFLAGFHEKGWNVNGEWVDNATLTGNNIVDPTCGTTLADLARAMKDGRMYVNAHSVAQPAGEIRGQLRPAP